MNISVKLNKNFTTTFNKLLTNYGEEFAKLNGLDESQLNYTDFIDNFALADTVADASIDGSSNVGHKDIVTLFGEMPKPHRKLLAYNKIYMEMNKKYGFRDANKWLEADWTRALYLHDADTSSFIPYCYAYDLKRLAEEGLFFLDNFNHQPPKHLGTFIDFVKEFVSYVTNRTSGACGLPNLLPYMYYFWDRDVAQGYYTVTPMDYAKQQIQRFLYAVNQPMVRNGIQSAFTNTNIFDHEYLMALFGGAVFPDGKFMVDELDGIMSFQKLFLEEMSRTRAENMFTYPVNSISLLRKNGKFVDEDFAKWACKHNMKWGDSNFFVDDSVTSLSNCCRLKSNIDDLGFFSSIGGTALRVGSVKVSTINLARLALEHDNEKDFLVALREITEIDLKVLDTVRHIIQRNIEKGFLPNYCDGLIDIKTQYMTIGVLGIYEVMKAFGYTTTDEFGNVLYKDEAFTFGKKIFDVINREQDQFALDKDYMLNIEAIPGEMAAAKMQKADEMLYPDKVVKDLPLYGNQFIPLGIKTTLNERLRVAAAFDSYCNGGSILHINIDSPFSSFDQAWKALNYISDSGITYFAFNTKISACEHNHGFYGNVCPTCGGEKVPEYTRTVGLFVPESTYSTDRKQHAAPTHCATQAKLKGPTS